LFERGDLLALIKRQQQQADSRLTDEELEIVKHALGFGDHKVADVMTPRKLIKTVLAGDTIGPILIDEVHKSGQGHVLVRESRKGPFVGTLAFKQLDLQSTGLVKDVMEAAIHYLHENDPLNQALHAFFVTNCSLFVVVNSFEEYVGILTIENVLHQLLGHVPGDDFDQYADIEVVAARHPKSRKKTKTATKPETTE
jgi:CBS domain containing-hemolysin-like protein